MLNYANYDKRNPPNTVIAVGSMIIIQEDCSTTYHSFPGVERGANNSYHIYATPMDASQLNSIQSFICY